MAQDSNYIAPTVFASGSAVAPAAGTGIASIDAANLPKGFYDLDITIGFGATAEATTLNNWSLLKQGVPVAAALTVANAIQFMTAHSFKRVFCNGSQNLSVNVGGVNASAGAVYIASIKAHPVL